MPNEKRSLAQARLTEAEKRCVEATAAKDGRTVSGWVRMLLKRALDDADAAGRTPDSEHQPQRR